MTPGPLRIGTRSSALARAQAGTVAAALRAGESETELVAVNTRGDTDRSPLAQIGGTGIFVGALRQALLAGEVDLAVHSLKDLPSQLADGIETMAVPVREDPRDVLVARDGLRLADLPVGARVGTGSPRRAAQLRMLRADIKVGDIRGNVDTRLRMVTEGELDGIVLAAAGLSRLDRSAAVTEVFDVDRMVPAPGQGALVVEAAASVLASNGDLARTVARARELDDPHSRAAARAERAVLAQLQAGCTTPVGAFAEVIDGPSGRPAEGSAGQPGGPLLHLRAVAVAVDGSAHVRLSTSGSLDEAEELGRGLAVDMLAEGASGLIEEPLQ